MSHGVSAMKAIGESIKTSIIDMLYQITLRPLILQLGYGIQNGLFGPGGGMAMGGGGAVGAAGSIIGGASCGW